MEKITLETVPAFVSFYPRIQEELDAQVSAASRRFEQPGFGLTLGPHFAAIAARKACGMPLTVEQWLLTQRSDQNGYQAQHSARTVANAAPPIGATVRAVQPKEMTREQAARHLTKSEFIEWEADRNREGKA